MVYERLLQVGTYILSNEAVVGKVVWWSCIKGSALLAARFAAWVWVVLF